MSWLIRILDCEEDKQMVIRIIHTHYTDADGNPNIGGVESYITALKELVEAHHVPLRIYQYGMAKKTKSWADKTTIIVSVAGADSPRKIMHYIDRFERPDYVNDLLIFASDFMISRTRFNNTVAIQHGVAWDIPSDVPVNIFVNLMSIFNNALRTLKKYLRYQHCKELVCVDYNFPNWYRSEVKHTNIMITVIPNFAPLLSQAKLSPNRGVTRIIFARRLVEYRGTMLFAHAIRELLDEGLNIQVTIAGEGPEKGQMKKILKSYPQVHFTVFSSNESVKFHSNYDIAVIPTKGSEGTSLSLLEAMSAGCAVVATQIGGIPNIIINGYNGILINGNVKSLEVAIKQLVLNPKYRNRIAANGLETVKMGFSLERWSLNWNRILSRYLV